MGEFWSWDHFQGTDKQREIMEILFKAADEGRKITPTDLWLELSYGHTCTRAAVLCSLNFLEKKWNLVQKSKRHGNLVYLTPTLKAYQELGREPPGAVISTP